MKLTSEDRVLIKELTEKGWTATGIWEKYFKDKVTREAIEYYYRKSVKREKVRLDFETKAINFLRLLEKDMKRAKDLPYEKTYQKLELYKIYADVIKTIKPSIITPVSPTQINILTKIDAIRAEVEQELLKKTVEVKPNATA